MGNKNSVSWYTARAPFEVRAMSCRAKRTRRPRSVQAITQKTRRKTFWRRIVSTSMLEKPPAEKPNRPATTEPSSAKFSNLKSTQPKNTTTSA